MTREDIKADLISLLDAQFPDHDGTYDEDSGPDDVAGWDSLAQVGLIADLEDRFHVRFEPADLTQLTSVGAIVDTIARLKNG